jgi:predicted O-methyltransferase YrrM
MEKVDTLTFLKNRYSLDFDEKLPIKVPIDKYRGLCGLFSELGFKVGAEIGVCKGMYSKWLSVKIRGLKLFCVDPYKSYKEYSEYLDQNEMDSLYKQAQQRLAKFNCEFVKKFSMDAVKDFNDNSLDFVYIDANHAFEFVVNDIAEWSKKVKPGGIVSGHDYSGYMFQVREAVDGWTRSKKIKPWFLTHKHACWFYVKDKIEPPRQC